MSGRAGLQERSSWNASCERHATALGQLSQQEEEIMAKAGKKKVRSNERRSRDLRVKPKAGADVKGGVYQ
jgi:hypothetical protein